MSGWNPHGTAVFLLYDDAYLFFFSGIIHQHETTATMIKAAIGQKPPSIAAAA